MSKTIEERLEALEDSMSTEASVTAMDALKERIETLEEQFHHNQADVAAAVLKTFSEHVLTGIVQKTVAAVEVEWTTKFLPELRRTIKADMAGSQD